MLYMKYPHKLLSSLLKVKNTIWPVFLRWLPSSPDCAELMRHDCCWGQPLASSTHLLGSSSIRSLRTCYKIWEASNWQGFRLSFWKLITLFDIFILIFTVKYFKIVGAQSCLFSISNQLDEAGNTEDNWVCEKSSDEIAIQVPQFREIKGSGK